VKRQSECEGENEKETDQEKETLDGSQQGQRTVLSVNHEDCLSV
jgi:hypothetical protein